MIAILAATSAQALDLAIWPDQLCVKPGQPVVLQVRVEGGAAESEVACTVVHGVDTVAATFTGRPDAAGTVVFTFTPTAEWGYEAVATVTSGDEQVTRSEVFACATSPFKVAVDYSVPAVYGPDLLPDGAPAPEGPVQNPRVKASIDKEVARFRHQYLTVGELFGPAFCPFSSLVPPTLNYYKGYHYNYSVNALRELIDTLHTNGIATLLYVNGCVSGLAGTEFARQYPQYLAYQPDGTPFGGALNLSTLDAHKEYVTHYPESIKRVQTDPAYRKQLTGPYPGFINCWLDFEDPRVAEIGAEKIIEGQQYFGFDGVRYDGEYRVPSIGDPLAPSIDLRNWRGEPQPSGAEAEALTARNLERAFGMMRRHDRDFLIGLNYADFRNDKRGDAVLRSPVTQTVSPGFWILDEVAKGALNPSAPEHHWVDFIRNMSDQVDRVRDVDNYLFAGWGGGPGHKVVDTRQIKAVSWACGLRWICGGPSKEAWFADLKREYNRFALRYSQFILDNRLRRLPPDEAGKALGITGSRPVLWQSFVQRLDTGERRYLVAHLVNAPLEEGLTTDAQQPPPVTDLRLTMGPDEHVVAIWFLSPDSRTMKLAVQDGTASLPELVNWGMVVIEQ